jgi:hypothetical protein
MFYKRPSLRRGGMPTGIDTLSPRVEAQNGFFGQRPLFFGDYKQIGLDFPSTMSGMQIPTGNQVMMKSFPQDASEMGVASVAKTKPSKKANFMIDDFSMSEMPLDVIQTSEEMLEDQLDIIARIANEGKFLTNEQRELADKYGIIYGQDLFKSENREEIEKQNIDKTADNKIDINEIANNVIRDNKSKKDFQQKVLEGEKKFLEESEKDPKINIKDNLEGETVEDSFDSEYDKQMRRLEKYLGSTNRETKGRLALALSDAIGTEGTIADKASALNKSLLGIMGQRRKDKKELAKIAFAATTELEKAKITAGKKGFSERRFDEYANLASKKDRTKSEESRFQILKDALGIKTGLTGPSATAAGKIASEVNKSIIELQTAAENEKTNIQSEIISGINQLLLIQGVTRDNVSGIIGFDVSNYLKADGGRVNKAMGGGASETPAEPVATNLSFEQLRTRLPKEITDDIVRLVATSEEALQDFAYIRTQGDVEKFNVKYGVNLVLPQNTA